MKLELGEEEDPTKVWLVTVTENKGGLLGK